MRSIGGPQRRQEKNGDPIDDCVPVGELRPHNGQGLQDVTDKEGLANVLSKTTVVNGPDVPEYPSAGQSQASIESIFVGTYRIC